jgi:cytochrome b561
MTERYTRQARWLHWSTAAVILALIATGFAAANTADPAAKAALLRPHLPLGIAALVLTVARLVVWWRDARSGDRPAPAGNTPAWQRAAARAVHVLLPALSLGMAASGIATVALSGAGAAIFGSGPLPDLWSVPPRLPHGIGARLIAVLILLHVAAALHHAFIRRDGTLARMGIGRTKQESA